MNQPDITLETAIAQRDRVRNALMDVTNYLLEKDVMPRMSNEARKHVMKRLFRLALDEMTEKALLSTTED